jgi:hypothetical protein
LIGTYQPHISLDTYSFDVADKSKIFRFQLEAFNNAGSVKSGVASFVLANVPDKPTN